MDGDTEESSISLEVVTMHCSRCQGTTGADALSTALVAMSRRLF
jgi:hypothetical protein